MKIKIGVLYIVNTIAMLLSFYAQSLGNFVIEVLGIGTPLAVLTTLSLIALFMIISVLIGLFLIQDDDSKANRCATISIHGTLLLIQSIITFSWGLFVLAMSWG